MDLGWFSEFGEEDALAVKTFPVRLQPPDASVAPRCLRVPCHAVMHAFNDRLIPDAAAVLIISACPAALHLQPVLLTPLSPHLPPTRGALSFPSLWWSGSDLITVWTFTPANDSF